MSIKTKIFNFGRKMAVKVGPHAPTLLLIGGVIAGGAAIYEVAKSSMKAPAIIEKHTESLEKIEDAKEHPEKFEHEDGTPVTEESYKRDRHAVIRSAAWDFIKLYWKAAALIAISCILIFSGFKVLNGRLARSAALATSLAATNDHIKNNIIAKYGAEEYRNLRFSSKDDILKQVEAPDVKPADQSAYKDPFRSYVDATNERYGEYVIGPDNDHFSPNPLIRALQIESLVNTINETYLPSRGFLTVNDVLEYLHLEKYKSSENHDKIAAIFGYNKIDLGLEDYYAIANDAADAAYDVGTEQDESYRPQLNLSMRALDDVYANVIVTIDPIGSVHDTELMKKITWRSH